MFKYLFICEGNVGRSQMAEAFYNQKFNGRFAISAGVKDVSQKYGGRPAKEVVQAMKDVGIDISGQKVKQFTEGMLETAEKIVVLCDKEICPKVITDRKNVLYMPAEDPYNKSFMQLEITRDRVRQIVDSLPEPTVIV